MHPGTIINPWNDMSEFSTTQIATVDYRPLIMHAGSFDKGPEKMMRVHGSDFYSLFGSKMNFAKHGQASIQAARIIDAGGELLIKRVVAEDATLANVILIATLATTSSQATDEDGNPLYYDAEGNTTTEVTDEVVQSQSTSIKWEAVTVEGCKTVTEVRDAAIEMMDGDSGKFPIVIVADNGRGASSKAIRITPQYETSRGTGNMYYNVRVFEGTNLMESVFATVDPDVTMDGKAYGLTEDSCAQVNAYVDPMVFDAFVEAVATAMGVDVEVARSYDLINMTNDKGIALEGLSVSEESVDLNSDFGIALESGDNGAFGDAPVGTKALENALVAFFKGTDTNEIYDRDMFPISAIFDANYPVAVKEAIAELVNFRQDMFFFRDLGIGNYNYNSIVAAMEKNVTRSKFIGDYCTSYQIYEPQSKKRVEVTMMYDMAACMVNLFARGAHVPCAGLINDMVLTSAIPGTLNFVPRITPVVNQLDLMEEKRVNYAIFDQQDRCIVQTLYTCHDKTSQLMYINNVLAVQEVLRAIRTSCPKIRYSFQTSTDFTNYATIVNNKLKAYKSNFKILRFDYQQNELQAMQKIFYGVLYFAFNDWSQTEIFDVYIINSEDQIS